MTVVGAGAGCVRWGYPGLLAIVASWFASPVLAGLLSALMLVCIKYGVLRVSGYLSSMQADLRVAPVGAGCWRIDQGGHLSRARIKPKRDDSGLAMLTCVRQVHSPAGRLPC